MKNLFLFLSFTLVIQGCSIFTSKTPEVQVQKSPAGNEQMYPDHTMLTPQEIPEPVIKTWNKDHSGMRAEWYKTDDGYFVFYISRKLQARIFYDASGNIVSRSNEVEGEDVPPAIREYMKAKYPGTQYGRTYLSTLANGEKRYEVHVNGDNWEAFDMSGNSLKK